jgi:hypothetical protein
LTSLFRTSVTFDQIKSNQRQSKQRQRMTLKPNWLNELLLILLIQLRFDRREVVLIDWNVKLIFKQGKSDQIRSIQVWWSYDLIDWCWNETWHDEKSKIDKELIEKRKNNRMHDV